MHSVLLLGAVIVLIAAPGIAAALAIYRPGALGIVTRCAAAFGFGFAVAGGSAFLLATAQIFWLATYLPLWLLATVALWVLALRRAPLREHFDAIAAELADNRVALLLGAAVILALLFVRAYYLHALPGPHYVYFLNGLEIANSHGVPSKVLEFDQAWPPATDKIFLDAFTGVLPLLYNNPLVGPGVLLWIAYAGAAISFWAFAWELGLRRTAILLPVLMLANTQISGLGMSLGYRYYRAEDFGIAIAFAAAALGVSAIRKGGIGAAVAAGVVLAVASASHLIPVVIVVLILGSVLVAEILRRARSRPRKAIAVDGLALGASAGILGLVLRLLAGGSFGLGGASNQASYSVVHTQFDPTSFMYAGLFLSRHRPESSHFYTRPDAVMQIIMHGATSVPVTLGVTIAILAVLLAVAIGFMLVPTEMGTVGLAGVGVLFGVTAIALYFSYRYHVWIEATFGTRRLPPYAALGLILPALGLIEGLLLLLGKWRWKISNRVGVSTGAVLGAVLVISVTAWLLPTVSLPKYIEQSNLGQKEFATWVRTNTPCGARFVLNQRSEGAVAALTGRFALDEGMGAFLRPDRLPHVINVLQAVRAFYLRPLHNEALLRQYHINYVVVGQPGLLGYGGPIPLSNNARMRRAPFLQRVLHTRWVTIYHVDGSVVQPVSPLLKGPYLQCRKGPATY